MPFNCAMLLLARRYRGKSQADVAQAAGLNQGHYSRIENGLLPDGPSPENIERIASALDFPVSFFEQEEALAGLPISVHPMHRKKASVGERDLALIYAELNIRLMHVRRYLGAVDVEPKAPLPWIDVDEGGGPQEVAKAVRRAWLLPDGPVDNLVLCCEIAGILVIFCDFPAGVDGVTMRLQDLPPCVFLSRRAPADRMRFSLAHEVGHIVMHRYPTDSIEEEANSFAGELLLPEKSIRRYFLGHRVTLESLARAKAYWKVSMQFLLFRATAVGVINRHQSEYLWKKISLLGWRTREPGETDIAMEEPKLFRHILNLHTRDLGYDMKDFSSLLRIGEGDIRKLYGADMHHDGRAKLRVIK